MTPDEARALSSTLQADGNGLSLRAIVDGSRIRFVGGSKGEHSLEIGARSPARVLAHWSGYVTSNGLAMPATAKIATPTVVTKKTTKQLDAEIAVALAKPAPVKTVGKQRVRRMAVVTFWGRPEYKAGGQQKLVEFTTSDRFARAWNSSGQRWNRSYEIDTFDKGTIWQGDATHPPNKNPSSGVRDIRPATLADLKRFKLKLPPDHTLAGRID